MSTEPIFSPEEVLARECAESGYRKVEEMFCGKCPDRRVIARIYAEPGGSLVLWALQGRGMVNRIENGTSEPTRAEKRAPVAFRLPAIADEDDRQTVLAICPRCRHGKMLVLRVNGVDVVPVTLTPATYARVVDGDSD